MPADQIVPLWSRQTLRVCFGTREACDRAVCRDVRERQAAVSRPNRAVISGCDAVLVLLGRGRRTGVTAARRNQSRPELVPIQTPSRSTRTFQTASEVSP